MMNTLIANALIARLMDARGSSLVLSNEDIHRYAQRNVRIEPSKVGDGLTITLLPPDPLLPARFAYQDLLNAKRLQQLHPRDPGVAQQVQSFLQAYAQALADLNVEQLKAFVSVMDAPPAVDDASPSLLSIVPSPKEPHPRRG